MTAVLSRVLVRGGVLRRLRVPRRHLRGGHVRRGCELRRGGVSGQDGLQPPRRGTGPLPGPRRLPRRPLPRRPLHERGLSRRCRPTRRRVRAAGSPGGRPPCSPCGFVAPPGCRCGGEHRGRQGNYVRTRVRMLTLVIGGSAVTRWAPTSVRPGHLSAALMPWSAPLVAECQANACEFRAILASVEDADQWR
jgi:hypothetical protein